MPQLRFLVFSSCSESFDEAPDPFSGFVERRTGRGQLQLRPNLPRQPQPPARLGFFQPDGQRKCFLRKRTRSHRSGRECPAHSSGAARQDETRQRGIRLPRGRVPLPGVAFSVHVERGWPSTLMRLTPSSTTQILRATTWVHHWHNLYLSI